MIKISIIVAATKNMVIGKDNELLGIYQQT
jgi:hypothetical protein